MNMLTDMNIMNAVRAPLDTVIANNPLYNVLNASPLAGIMANGSLAGVLQNNPLERLNILDDLMGGRNLADLGAALPLGDLSMPLRSILDGGLPRAGLLGMPEEFVKVRELFLGALGNVTSIPRDALMNFLDITEAISSSVPLKNLYRPEVRQFMTEKRIVDLFASLEAERLNLFRDTLSDLGVGRGEPGQFMGRMNLDVFDNVREDLFNNVLADGPLSNLLRPAKLYFADIFPVIGDIAATDRRLFDLGNELGSIAGIAALPVDVVARLVAFKIELLGSVVSLAEDAVVTVADVGTDLVVFAGSLAAPLVDIALVLPNIAIEVIFEMLVVVSSIAEGVIDAKLAALDFLISLPVSLITPILALPVSVLDTITMEKFAQIDTLRSFWTELTDIVGVYTDYSSLFNLSPEVFPMERFANMSRDLIRAGASAVPCVGEMCFVE